MARSQIQNRPLLSSLTDAQAVQLCGELRRELIGDVARNGGHLASNLGVVELTVAIHRVYDTSRDRLVFDVGHQCYVHKMLTGRRERMGTLRQFGGISGFPNPEESIHDAFIAGHASNSAAVAVGMARARTLLGEHYRVLALMGDGALTGGLAYEGLSNAGGSGEPLVVLLNDNGMSITRNVGGVAEHLAHQRLKPQYLTVRNLYRRVTGKSKMGRGLYRVTNQVTRAVKRSLLPSSLFEDMGFTYLGPVNGHDVAGLTRLLRYASELEGPVLLHVRTTKGRGYAPAEHNPDTFHGIGPFYPRSGELKAPGHGSFSAAFGTRLCALAEQDRRVCAITAAMRGGTGLDAFQQRFPERFFDVGIAEGCAVSMAAGMAKQGLIPVFAVYSTFLQRSYDMLLHDVGLQRLHVVFAVDRAGLVGEDGETHQGIFDLSFLSSVPHMRILAPASFEELGRMLEQAVLRLPGPVALRYPRGGNSRCGRELPCDCSLPTVRLYPGTDLTLVSYGTLLDEALDARRRLEARGLRVELFKLNQIHPLEAREILASVQKTGALLVAEECVRHASAGERLCALLETAGIPARVALCDCGEDYVPHGTIPQLRQMLGLDAESLSRRGWEVAGHGKAAAGCSSD